MRVAPEMLRSVRVTSRLVGGFAVAVLVLAMAGSTAFANGLGGPSTSAPSVCPGGSTEGQVVNTGHAVSISAGASFSCPEPGGYSFGNQPKASFWVPNGTSCTQYRYQPLTFSDEGETAKATYTFPNGQVQNESLSSFPDAGIDNYWIEFSKPGTVQNQVCNVSNSLTWKQDAVVPGEWVITPGTSQFVSDPNVWAGDMYNFLNNNSGTIGTMPQTKGLVGLPQCFWINDLQASHEREVVLDGSPDVSGRQIRYVLIIVAQLGTVEWHFGDPYSNAKESAPSECGAHNQITAHTYSQISWYQPNHVYQGISATETWTLSAYLYWYDTYGYGSRQITLANPTQNITTPSITLSVGQEEGVPVQ
jgi:hypothetical protein